MKYPFLLAALISFLLCACGTEEAPQPVYDDSLLKEVYIDNGEMTLTDGSFAESGGKLVYSYHIPHVVSKTEEGKALNLEIEKEFSEPARAAKKEITAGKLPRYQKITWRSFWNGSMLGLILAKQNTEFFWETKAYTFDFAEGEWLNNREMLSHLGVSEAEFLNAMDRVVSEEFARQEKRMGEAFREELNYLKQETKQSISVDLQMFTDGNGRLAVITPVASPAGGGVNMKTLYPVF